MLMFSAHTGTRTHSFCPNNLLNEGADENKWSECPCELSVLKEESSLNIWSSFVFLGGYEAGFLLASAKNIRI